MSNLYPEYNFFINGQQVNPPTDWLDLSILATFEKGSPEANITTTELEFANENAKYIRDWILGGVTGATDGIFQGIPFKIQIVNTNNIYDSFEGYIDLSDSYNEVSPVIVKVKIKKIAGVVTFSERIEGLTFGYLKELGIFSNSDYTDCPYVLEREFVFIEFAMLSITTFMLARELIDTIRRLASNIAETIGHATGGLTGPVAAAIYGIAIALLNLVYAVLMVIYLLQLAKELISYLFNPTRIHKGATYRTLLTKACAYLGYGFSSSIPDMDVVNLPSKSARGRLDISQFNPPLAQLLGSLGDGLPNSGDFGYTVGEMFTLVNMLFYSKSTIRKVNGVDTVFVEAIKNDAFWIPTSGYTLPDVLDEQVSYNTDELKANRLLSFQLDLNDFWTLGNYRGNSYEITTDAITTNNVKLKTLKGLEEVRFPVALPTRKNGLTEIETALRSVAQVVDSVINFFGGNSNMAGYINGRVGMMKVSSDMIQVPKAIKYVGGKLPANYRDIWSAKYLEDNYHFRKSFVRNNYIGQKRVFSEREIPFSFTGFLSLLNYGSCPTSSGSVAEIDSIKWTVSSDTAIADYKVRQIYTKNLKETFREEADNADNAI